MFSGPLHQAHRGCKAQCDGGVQAKDDRLGDEAADYISCQKNLANKIFTVEKRINGIFKLILTHLRKLVARKELHTHCCKNKLNLWETMLRPEGEKKGGELGGCER